MIDQNRLLLAGKTVVITRAKNQQSDTRKSFEECGAKVLDLPALIIGPPDEWGPLDDALSELESFHWIVFSSMNGVEALEARLALIGRSLKIKPRSLKIAAVGRKTASFLESFGTKPDFIPPQYVVDSLIQNFPVPVSGLKLLVPRVQSGGRTLLSEAFGEAGARVVEVPAYESRCPDNIPEAIIKAINKKGVDFIAFTSSKTVKHTAQLMADYFGINWQLQIQDIKLISIGPQTSITCKKYFARVDGEANPHDLGGLINACIDSIKITN